VIAALRRLGIDQLDPNKRNIAFDPHQEARWEAEMESDGGQDSPSSASIGGAQSSDG